MKQLRSSFKEVAREFFPRWNHQGWKIRMKKRLPMGHAWCDRKNRIIYGNFTDKNDRLDLVFIHEITHAVTSDSHSPRFFNRMSKAVEHSRRIGRTELSELLLHDISVHKTGDLKLSDILERMDEILIDIHEVPWQELKGYLLHEFALDSYYFDKHFKKKARKFYEERRGLWAMITKPSEGM
jgi:hypothetical protein